MSEPVESVVGAAAEVEGVTAVVETGAMGEIRQEAGQRRWGGPPTDWDGPPPPKRGAEVFVGKLPRDADETELLPVLKGAGRLWELRLMVDFSGANRGFAFATYASKEEARSACASLNNAELRPGKHLGVVMSVDNCRLFVGGIPRERRREEILAEVSRLVDGVRDVIVYPSAADKSKNRGFAFVEFESHKGAAQARRKLGGGGGGSGGRVQLWGAPICVDWAEPEQEVDEGVMATVRVLYVRNLMLATTEESIRAHFDALRPGTVERVKKLKDFAFVHYTSREAALANLAALNGSLLDSAVLEVQLSKPPDKTILRYVKSAQRSSGGAVHGPHAAAGLSQEVLAAATHNFLQAAQQPSPLSLAAAAQLDPLAWAYAGAPLLQPPLLGPAPPDAAARAASLHRGAAGMRSAGFVAQVNKHVRNARSRRSAELVGGYEAAYPYPPLFPPPPSPISPTATAAAAAPGVVWLPAVQAQHLHALSLQPSLDLGAASLGAGALGTAGLAGGKATDTLSVYCRSAGLGEPSLEVEEVLLRDVTGASVTLYSAAVVLPALAALPGGATPLGKSANPFQSPEEAKECAAQLALIQLASAAATLAPQAATLLPTVSAPPHPPVPANLPPTPLLTPEAFPPLTPAVANPANH